MACLISSVEQDASKRPILVSFLNGILEDSTMNQFDTKILTNNKKVKVFSRSKSMLYAGDVSQNEDTNHFFVIINRNTNKARFVAVDTCSLAPVISSKKSDILNNTSKEQNWNASTIMLNKTFGSKRAQRAGEQMERLNQEVSKFKDDLEKTVRETEIENALPGEIIGTCNPPMNKDATTVEEVYEISNIIPNEVLDTLKVSSKSLLKNGPEQILTTELALNFFDHIKASSATSKAKRKKCRIIMLLDTLVNLVHSKYNVIAMKSFKVCILSDQINRYVLDTFTTATAKGRTRSMAMKDKTVCYIIVLSLLINNYTVSLMDLSKAFGMTTKRLQDFCKILSLTLNKNKADADLVLPLPKNVILPKLPRKRKLNTA